MSRFRITGLAFITIASTAFAQATVERREVGRGGFQVGYLAVDVDKLNDALAGAGFPRLKTGFLTIGGNGYAEHGRWLIGGEGHALIGSKRTTEGGAYQIVPSGGYGMFRVGYKVFSSGLFDVSPSFGIGGGGLGVEIRGRSAPTFDDVLANPGRSSRLSTGVLLLDVSVAASHRIAIKQKEAGAEGGLMLSATAGYMFEPASSDWTLDGMNSVAGGPTFRMQGFYARFSFGGWGSHARK
jgi:hypothetical protein